MSGVRQIEYINFLYSKIISGDIRHTEIPDYEEPTFVVVVVFFK